MLGHMLHAMRLEADAVVPAIRNCDTSGVIMRLTEQFEGACSEANITPSCFCSAAPLATDEDLLERALSNLVANAIAHSGVSLLRITARDEGGLCRISVEDDGVGIADGDRGALFNDYSQGSNSRAPIRSGFGLGLSSVRRIAHLLGGDVAYSNSALGGACFTLSLRRQL